MIVIKTASVALIDNARHPAGHTCTLQASANFVHVRAVVYIYIRKTENV